MAKTKAQIEMELLEAQAANKVLSQTIASLQTTVAYEEKVREMTKTLTARWSESLKAMAVLMSQLAVLLEDIDAPTKDEEAS
jgi:uncharacterized protein YigA (DUF484 family)